MKLINVKKSYESKVVFENLTLELPENKISCVMGASGCGKTTLSRLLLGLEKPDGGKILGNEGRGAAVFQEDRLCEGLSAEENVRLVYAEGRREDALALLAELGLAGHTDKAARELSGGMRRRVAIARALFAPFDFLVLDEAFTGLDEDTKAEVLAVVKQRCAGKTVLLITHDEEEARSLSDRIFLMEGGSISPTLLV